MSVAAALPSSARLARVERPRNAGSRASAGCRCRACALAAKSRSELAGGVGADEVGGGAASTFSGTRERIELAVGRVARDRAGLAAEADAEPDHEILRPVADDLVSSSWSHCCRRGARDGVVARTDVIEQLSPLSGVDVPDRRHAAMTPSSCRCRASVVARACRVVAVPAHPRCTPGVGRSRRSSLKTFGSVIAELVLDQLLERLQRARRRQRRELGGVVAAGVRPLEARLPLVERGLVGGRVAALTVNWTASPASGRRCERAGVVGDRRARPDSPFVTTSRCRPGPSPSPSSRRRSACRRARGSRPWRRVEDRDVGLRKAASLLHSICAIGEPAQVVGRLLDRLDLRDEVLGRDADSGIVASGRRRSRRSGRRACRGCRGCSRACEGVALDRVLVAGLPLVVVRGVAAGARAAREVAHDSSCAET